VRGPCINLNDCSLYRWLQARQSSQTAEAAVLLGELVHWLCRRAVPAASLIGVSSLRQVAFQCHSSAAGKHQSKQTQNKAVTILTDFKARHGHLSGKPKSEQAQKQAPHPSHAQTPLEQVQLPHSLTPQHTLNLLLFQPCNAMTVFCLLAAEWPTVQGSRLRFCAKSCTGSDGGQEGSGSGLTAGNEFAVASGQSEPVSCEVLWHRRLHFQRHASKTQRLVVIPTIASKGDPVKFAFIHNTATAIQATQMAHVAHERK